MSAEAKLQHAAIADRLIVHLYTLCWDEADMLGFFFRHYDPFVERYVIYDDGSTDGSREILHAHPKVELRDFPRTDPDSFVLSHRAMQNEAWKESRHRADWIVVTAIDEHLHVPGRAMADYLAEEADRGVTLIPALGFDLNHIEMPDDAGLLVERVTRGRPRLAFNKLSIFKPEALRETGFGPGRHAATPEGDLVLPPHDTLQLWHYKHLGFERNATREAIQAERLGQTDRAEGFGQHYLWGSDRLRIFWDEMERESIDLAAADAGSLAIRPLWWEEQGMRRANSAPLPRLVPASPRAVPTVSVLIKSYQHAPYVRQTIESLLAQSFQDFEIVVTDDGSTDGTAEILRGITDPRIRLECRRENQGISAAMNATVARARGRYLAILNSDDWALPGRLRRQVGFLDAHPDVAAVFGMPRAVDENGLPTQAYNDFTVPLRFTDFSRRTWLRYLFFQGNTLCAPTAMIRREAYEAAGPYDPRLTNLQDFDMWIRMLMAGQNIHVLPDSLTAFRIRDGMANASAPNPEARLRSTFEHSMVLRRFKEMGEVLFSELFDPEEITDLKEPLPLRFAELASKIDRPEFRSFALHTLYEEACTPKQLTELREWGSRIDALGVRGVEECENRLRTAVTEREALAADRDRNVATLRHKEEMLAQEHRTLAERDTQIAELRKSLIERIDAIDILELNLAYGMASQKIAMTALHDELDNIKIQLTAATESLNWMRSRLTWRMTVPFRQVTKHMRLIRQRMNERRL
ncbi:hypothetical protein AFCDBAGC_2071 [Methylobacterium cerastii]|uniref:Glycosyltransferase 2-like domain-containing protein n=1 Tax=Methylobacterium cerastii TaxID=932741 RepID=A0ABQ4QG67_9HYPH|nr:glycosyltransferase [Methylobacterium cerastii]GJD44205.1 hypothetical protein AFCDBAGC_2071 [Methylobacterium cerastii]